KRLPRTVAARQRARGGLAHVPHAERIDEAFQRDLVPRCDGSEQIAHRQLAVSLHILQLELGVAFLEGEDVGRLLDPALLEEQLDLLVAQALDVEGATRGEMLQVLDLLVGAGELAAAARARPPPAPGDGSTPQSGLDRARTG